MISSLNSACRDFNAKLKKKCCHLALGQLLKLPTGIKFFECRDIKFLVATFSTLGGTSHPLVVKINPPSICRDVATRNVMSRPYP